MTSRRAASLDCGPFVGFEHTFSIRTSDPAVAAWLTDRFASLSAPASSPGHRYELAGTGAGPISVLVDDVVVRRTTGWADALPWLLWKVNQDVIASARGVVLHAGAVEVEAGALLVVGRSGAGKSTLVAALTGAGLPYVTDEAVAISPGGRLIPWPKPLSLSHGSLELLGHRRLDSPDGADTPAGEQLVPVAHLGTRTEAPSLPLAALVLLEPDAGPPAAMTGAGMLAALPPHVLRPRPLDRAAVDALGGLLRAVPCWRIGRPPLHDPGRLIHELGRDHTACDHQADKSD